MKKSEQSLRDLQNNIKQINIHIIRVQEGKEKKKSKKEKNEIEKLIDEIMAENFPNLEKKLTSKSKMTREFKT